MIFAIWETGDWFQRRSYIKNRTYQRISLLFSEIEFAFMPIEKFFPNFAVSIGRMRRNFALFD